MPPRQVAAPDRHERAQTGADGFKSAYGPTIAVYAAIADDPDAVRTLDAELTELARSADLGVGRMDWEYLLWSGTRV